MRNRLFTLLFLLSGTCSAATLQLPTIFSDHMVLQREQPVPVWGTADPNTIITVEFAGQTQTTTANADGTWRIDLVAMPASSESRELKVSSNHPSEIDPLPFSDVLVGEVWLCSGQSNMQMPLKGFKIPTDHAAKDIAAANLPLMRLYKTPMVAAGIPKDRIDATWTTCTPETAAEFSATAFYFGHKIQQDLNVPVGLLQSAWGGTRIEPWTPPCGFESFDSLTDIREQIKTIPPTLGADPKKVRKDRQTPTALYNGMLAAHIPYAIKGAIWYQGEANHREDAMLYIDKTAALLKGWRGLWGYDFPYYFVQIAPYQYGTEDPSVLAEFWEAQAQIVKTVPKTGMAVITDVTMLNDIHPTNKEAPGTRLALLALDNTYGKKVISTGPTFKKMKKPFFGGNTLKIVFDSANGLTTRDGQAPDWFEIVGEDGIFKPAQAVIEGRNIILSSPDVATPVAMRFAWHKLAIPNLMNAAGLPAPTFRAGKAPEPKHPDLTQIPEMKGFEIIYQLNIPVSCRYGNQSPEYHIDNSAKAGPFKRVAYLLELQKASGEVDYAFASMDAFIDDVKQIAVPTAASGARFMQQVGNLTVRSNVAGVESITGSDGGNIEFWPGNYSGGNANAIPGADDKTYDFGDIGTDKIPGYGCMQVHNWKAKQTIFAFNRFSGTPDLGIGNSEGKTSDWTFTGNGGTYSFRRLTVLVK